jgi:hypothetical protein
MLQEENILAESKYFNTSEFSGFALKPLLSSFFFQLLA